MMKIAIPSDDRSNVSEHTGRATFFAIASIEDENMTHLEFRDNPPREHGADGEHYHSATVSTIKDCEIVIVRNIGKKLRGELQAQNKKIVFTSSNSIGESVKRYLGSTI
jgi:predicted Fe-Mo cluster-binding NifX family protein